MTRLTAFTQIEEAERDEIINDLQCVAEATATSLEARRAAANIQLVQFFKVPFQSCLDLVRFQPRVRWLRLLG